MQCFIYRSERKEGLYVYLAKEDNFDCLPTALLNKASPLTLAMELELDSERRLRREDTPTVMTNLTEVGYHVQMPEKIESLVSAFDTHSN